MPQDIQQRLDNMEREIADLKKNQTITRDLSFEQQDSMREIINDKIAESTWNNFFYASDFVPFTLIVTSNTEGNEKLRDTTGNKFLTVDKPTKLRVAFYFGNTGLGAGCTAYVTTCHVRTVSGTAPILGNGAEFVGLKIVNNKIFLCSYVDANKTETLVDINKTIVLDETILLEIQFFPRERADFYINNVYVGSITGNLPSNNNPIIYFPLFVSLLRTDALNHNVNIDYYEFIQDRN